ncbi:MAG: hypothetical protein KatS3mg003_1611 [Candidatus Nitrosocaldaceae archaeon]|nr:MAG: hypothetical protein KatS3mg003_0456 [Candidatus Nitrosocaldaceae archaeon]GIU72132.1 MAG: hypothetical protein KatS3mg003_1611 [Candidatus Nitrosocaldaceae archaeon]
MNLTHDEFVDVISRSILNNYKDIFKDVFISRVSMDFPKPDFVFIPLNIRKVYYQ